MPCFIFTRRLARTPKLSLLCTCVLCPNSIFPRPTTSLGGCIWFTDNNFKWWHNLVIIVNLFGDPTVGVQLNVCKKGCLHVELRQNCALSPDNCDKRRLSRPPMNLAACCGSRNNHQTSQENPFSFDLKAAFSRSSSQ